MKAKQRQAWLVAGLWWLFLTVVQLLPSTGKPPAIPYGDKLAHGFLFGVLVYLLFRACAASNLARKYLGIFLVGAIAYGSLCEFVQGFMPARQADVWDFAADALGSVVGATVARLRGREQ